MRLQPPGNITFVRALPAAKGAMTLNIQAIRPGLSSLSLTVSRCRLAPLVESAQRQ